MAKTKTSSPRHRRVLTLKVAGQLRPGKIAIPDLLQICQHVQSAINRQAEAMEGRQTLRRGRKLEKVKTECTLELASLRHGSPMTVLGFDLAKPQQTLPMIATFGDDAVASVAETIERISEGDTESVDPGVLHSLNGLGEVFDKRVKSITWIVPSRPRRKKREVRFDQKVRRKVAARLSPPDTRHMEVEGIIEMADFRPSDLRCRIHPVFGPPVQCVFTTAVEDEIYAVLRRPARVKGVATVNTQTGKLAVINISGVTPIEPLTMGAGYFTAAYNIERLADIQAIEPLHDVGTLAGGWPEDENIMDFLADIYSQRQ